MVPPSHDTPRFTTPTSIISIKYALFAGTRCSRGFDCTYPGCLQQHVPPSFTTTKKRSDLKSSSDGCAPTSIVWGGGYHDQDNLTPTAFRRCHRKFPRPCRELIPTSNPPAEIDPTNIIVFPAWLFSIDFCGATRAWLVTYASAIHPFERWS